MSDDSDLRAQFEQLKSQDAAAVRPFSDYWEEARRSAVRRRLPLYRLMPVAAALVLVTFAVILVGPRPPRPAPPGEISEWRSPTAFLLRAPGSQLFTTMPRFGKPLLPTHPGQTYR